MSYPDISRIAVVTTSLFITCGLYVQAWRIWKTKSAKDFSLVLVLALLSDEVAWVNYGVMLFEWPIIVVGLANLPAVLMATIGYFKFRRSEDEKSTKGS